MSNSTTQKNKTRKNGGKDEKGLSKLMKNTANGKTMEDLRNRIDAKLVNKEKDYLKRTSKRSYLLRETFDNDLVAICKIKLNKNLINQHMLNDLSKVLIYLIYLI